MASTQPNLLRRLRRAEEGTAAVEFAMILPVVMIILFMTITIGRLLNDYHVATKSVRDATRYLSRMDFAATCAAISQTDPKVVEAKTLVLTGKVNGSLATDLLIPGWNDLDSVDVQPDCFTNTGAFTGFYDGVTDVQSVIIQATVPFTFTWGQLIGIDPTFNFTITQKMVLLRT